MKKLSVILASMVLFAGLSFGQNAAPAKKETKKTEKKGTMKTEKKGMKKGGAKKAKTAPAK